MDMWIFNSLFKDYWESLSHLQQSLCFFIFKAGIFSLHFYDLFPSITVYVCEGILHMAFSVGIILQVSLYSLYLLMCLYVSPFWEKYVIFPSGDFTNSFRLRLEIKILTNGTFGLTFLLASLTKSYMVFLDTWGLKQKLLETYNS